MSGDQPARRSLGEGGPPDWVADYIGIPFVENGRDRDGCDCWGLVRLVLAERYGLALPSHAEGYDGHEDTAAIEALIGGAAEAGSWQRIPAPEAGPGDLAVMRGVPTPHIGLLVAPGVMLHTRRGAAASLARTADQAWSNRLRATERQPFAGFYRYDPVAGRRLVPAPLQGEVLGSESTWTLSIAPHPFKAARRTVAVPAGLSLEEAFAREQPDALLRLHGAAWIADQRVPARRLWARIRPKPGASVAIRALPPVPAGGDGKVLRVALMIAVVASAILVPELVFGLSGWQAGLLGAGIGIAGSLLVNALLPVQNRRLDDSGASSPSFSIEGAQNLLRPYEPIPRPLGQHRKVGDLGARTYRQIRDGDVYFHILLVWGYGPLEVADLKIGETPIEDFDDVEIETREGFPGDAALTLYTNDVFEEVPGVTLTAAAGFVTRRSQAGADELDLDFTFPRGLVGFDEEDGDKQRRVVELMIQFAAAGTEAWSADDAGTTVAAGSLDLGTGPSGRHAPFWVEGEEAQQEPWKNRTDAVVIDRITGAVSAIIGRESRVVFSGRFGELRSYPPQVPKHQASLAWVYRRGDNATTIEAGAITDRRDSPDVEPGVISADPQQRRPVRVAFATSDVLVAADRIRQTTGAFRENEIVRLGSSGTLPAGLSAGINLYVVNATAASYQLSLNADGDPIAITDAGSGTHYASSIAAAPATSFAVTPDSPTSTTVDYGGGTLIYRGIRAEAATTSAYRIGVNIRPPAAGQYDVRVKRVTPDSTDELTSDEVIWTGLRSIAYRDPFTLAGVARSAIVIRANEQLEGRVEPISAVLTSLAKVWNGSTWDDDQPTRNPAALFRLVAQDAANKAARTDAQLDLAAIQDWHETCAAEGWTFDMPVDFRTTVPEMLGMVAAAGMASPTVLDGKLSVIQDVEKTVPVQHVTPRNSNGYRGRVRYPEVPHAFRVRFIDATSGWKNNERIVYDDGYTAANATVFAGIEFPGVTDPELIWRHARRRIAEARLRPEEHRVWMDIEGLVATRGDLVMLSQDAIKVGLGYGRLKSVALGGGGEALSVTLDATVAMAAGTSYVLRIRDETGASILEAVTNPGAGEYTSLTFATPITSPTIAAGDVFLFGETDLESRPMIVTGIRPDADLGFELTLVDLAPGVFKADDLAYAFTSAEVDAGADTIDQPPLSFGEVAAVGFFDGDGVIFGTDGALPRPLVAGPPYYVVNRTAATFQVAETEGGSALDLLDGGTGNHSAARQIPAFDAGISTDPVIPEQGKPAAPVIEAIRSDESVMVTAPDGGLEARIAVRFRVPPTDTAPDSLEAQIRESAGDQPWRRAGLILLPALEIVLGEVETGDVVDLRVRTITRLGVPSDWTTETGYTVAGSAAPPPDVTGLRTDGDMLRWELADPPVDLDGFRVRWHEGTDQTWPTAEPLTPQLIRVREVSIADLRGATRTLLVKAVDKSGNESVNAAALTLDLAFVLAPNALESRDLEAEGFPGTIAGADVVGTGPGTTLDRAGGNNGTLAGSPTWVKGLRGNSALRFDGADRSVSMGDIHDFTGTAAFTIACRFRARIPTTLGAGNHYILVNKRESGAANGYTLWISAADNTLRALRHGGGTDTELIGPALADQTEYVAAMVYDGSDFRLVLDGATVDGPDASSQSIVNHAGDFRVGKDSNVGAYRFDGVIDEVQVWNVARSNAQIAADTAALLAGTALTDAIAAGLVGYWPFEEGTIAGDLEALPLSDFWVPAGDALPAWESEDQFSGYWDNVHAAVTYDFSHAPDTALLPGDLRRDLTVAGRSVALLVALDNPPYWDEILDTAPFWTLDNAGVGIDSGDYWLPSPSDQLWPGRITNVTRQAYEFRIALGAGKRQGRVSALSLVLEGIVTEVTFDDLAVAVGGTRIPLPGPYHLVTEVLITLQDDGGTAVRVNVADKDPLLGPLLIARNSAGASVAATVDVVLKGVPK